MRLVYVDRNRGVEVSNVGHSKELGVTLGDKLIGVNGDTLEVAGAFGLLQKFWSTEPPIQATFQRHDALDSNDMNEQMEFINSLVQRGTQHVRSLQEKIADLHRELQEIYDKVSKSMKLENRNSWTIEAEKYHFLFLAILKTVLYKNNIYSIETN